MHRTMDIQALYQIYLKHKLIDTDTRKIRRDSIFFALKGENFNGNDFAEEALSKGAAWAVVDDRSLTFHPQFVSVVNVLETLQQLAAWHRRKARFRILAVTGSNGKTTTKELCRAILAKKYTVQATEGNLNNHIGVPLSLLSMDMTNQLGIIEMGANHPGEISFLCDMAKPDYGLITNIGKAHLEGFGRIEGVVRAKGELFAHLIQRGKTLFVNQGDERVMGILPDGYGNMVFYNGDKGLHAEEAVCNPFLELEAVIGTRKMHLKTQLVGRYNTENVLAACCVGLKMGISEEEIVEVVSSYRPQGYRSQFINSGKNRIFMDAYNANPSSMMAAINEFLVWQDERKLVILGEMKELGHQSVAEHENIISYLKDHNLSDVLCVGGSFEKSARIAGYLHFKDVEALTEYIKLHPLVQMLILIKGSRSNRLEKLLEVL